MQYLLWKEFNEEETEPTEGEVAYDEVADKEAGEVELANQPSRKPEEERKEEKKEQRPQSREKFDPNRNIPLKRRGQ